MRSSKRKARYTAQRYLNSQSGLSFDGVDDYIDLGNKPEYNFTSDFSISVWVRVRDFATYAGQNGIIVGKGDAFANGQDSAYYLAINGTSSFIGNIREIDGTSRRVGQLNQNLLETVWYHLVLTFDEAVSEGRLYINGVLNEAVTVLDVFTNNDTLVVGYRQDLNLYSGMDLAHVSLFNKALSQDEVSALHTWKGHIPESAQPHLVEYQPLQYNDFDYIPIDINYLQ